MRKTTIDTDQSIDEHTEELSNGMVLNFKTEQFTIYQECEVEYMNAYLEPEDSPEHQGELEMNFVTIQN